jgi:hypothetical protein
LSDLGKPIRDFFGEDTIANVLMIGQVDHDFFSKMTVDEEAKLLLTKY